MLKAFIDESVTADKMFVMAGYIATVEDWVSFSDEWQRLLDMRSPHYRQINAFKMSEMAQSERSLEQSSWFYKIIEKHVKCAISCTVNIDDLVRSVNEFPWPEWVTDRKNFADPYFFGFRIFAAEFASIQDKIGIAEPVDFVFDEHSHKAQCLTGRQWFMDDTADKSMIGDTPIFRKDENALPLQAADLYAYWVRDWALKNDEDGLKYLKFPWKIERDIPRMDINFSGNDFNEIWHRLILAHVESDAKKQKPA